MQPLDRTSHKAMRTSIERSIARLLCRFQDMGAKQLADIINPAWVAAFKPEIVRNGWRKAGLIPFDPSAPISEVATRKAEDVKQAEVKKQQQQAAENARQAERKADGKDAKAAPADGKQDPAAALDAVLQVPQLPPAKPRNYKRPQFPTGGDLTDAKAIADMREYERTKKPRKPSKTNNAVNGAGGGRGNGRGGKRRASMSDSAESSESDGDETPDSGNERDDGESEGEAGDEFTEDVQPADIVRCGHCKTGIADLSTALQCDNCGIVQHARCAGHAGNAAVAWVCAGCKGKRKNKKK